MKRNSRWSTGRRRPRRFSSPATAMSAAIPSISQDENKRRHCFAAPRLATAGRPSLRPLTSAPPRFGTTASARPGCRPKVGGSWPSALWRSVGLAGGLVWQSTHGSIVPRGRAGRQARPDAGCRPRCRRRHAKRPANRLVSRSLCPDGPRSAGRSDHRAVTAAARDLAVSQPAVTKHFRNLERRVGARLLERSSRIVRPTPQGQALYDVNREALVAIDAALERVSKDMGTVEGNFRIHAPSCLGAKHLHGIDVTPAAAPVGYRRSGSRQQGC